MGYILLTFLTAFGIEALGTYVSIIGLSTLFGANPIIMAIAVALDVGKLLVVSLLYTYWKKLGFIMKSYALVAATVTMLITSAGAMGYLSGEFQKAIMGSQENTLKVDVLKGEQAKLEERKKQIDQQIADLPKNYSNSRIKLMKEFSSEQTQITDRLTQINKDLPALQIEQIGVEAKVGPILYISKAFDVPVEVAVKYVILLIIFVFDPLAVFLIIAGNFLLHLRRTHKDSGVAEADLFEEKPPAKLEPIVPLADVVFEEAEESRPKPDNGMRELRVPTVMFNTPDASQAKVYEDPPHEGPMAKTHDDAHVEREFVGAPEPVFEEHEGPMAKTHDDDHVHRVFIGAEEPPTPPPPAPIAREVITREQLQPPQYFSSLGAVKADETVKFSDGSFNVDDDESVIGQYRNLK